MAVYQYKGLNLKGKELTGVIDADNTLLARAKLRKSGVFPISVLPADNTDRSSPLFSERVTVSDLAVMTRQLSTLLGAGIPLMEALSVLLAQVEKRAAKKVWVDVREGIKEGMALSDTLERHPAFFPSIYYQMVRAGEASGTLDQILIRLADYLESQARLRNKLFSLLAYPLLMLVLSLFILLFLISFVVPKVTAVFADLKQALPLPTVILLSVSDFLRNYGWFSLILGAVSAVALKRYLGTPHGRRRYDRWALTIPIIGRVVQIVAVSRFTRTLAILLASGLPLLTAMEMVAQVVGNKMLEDAIQKARAEIREGEGMAEPLKRSGFFPPLVTHMVAVGEKSGALEGMLQKLSEAYDDEVETTVSGLTSLFGPLLILGMGLIVLFIVLAILLPIFEMSQMVR